MFRVKTSEANKAPLINALFFLSVTADIERQGFFRIVWFVPRSSSLGFVFFLEPPEQEGNNLGTHGKGITRK